MKTPFRIPASWACVASTVAVCLLGWLTPLAAPGEEPTLARKLCAEYAKIDTVSCEIQKTISTDGRSIKWLSRVYYQKDNRIHVENVAPSKRHIITDGKVLYYYGDGDRRGYRKPVAELSDDWLISLHTVPGTPMDHLLKLKDLPEITLNGTADLPVRRAYQAAKVFVVLICDPEGRLVRIEFYSTSDMKAKIAEYEYGFFRKVADLCWIPCLHKATLYLPNGDKAQEVRRINNLEVNMPIAPKMFDPQPFFEGVKFTDNFDKTYEE